MRPRSLLILIVLMVALAGGAFAYVKTRPARGPLTGLPVTRDRAGRRAIAVMFDNLSPDARPQSGLNAASLVFETLAEGGITRFMAVYDEWDAPTVGPVRSTRIYFNSWAAGLGVIFGHDGGNVDALRQLPALTGIADVDAGRAGGPYYRIGSRLAPHNEYTSTGRLRRYVAAAGGSTSGAPPSLPFKDDAPLGQRPASFTLNVQFSYGDYNVTWRYDRTTNQYLRFMGGAPHVEATTGKQLTARNVVVMMARETTDPDPFTPGSIAIQTVGTGPVTVYRDGQAVPGVWSKNSVAAPLRWLDPSGTPIPLNRGTTWIEVVPAGNAVTTSR